MGGFFDDVVHTARRAAGDVSRTASNAGRDFGRIMRGQDSGLGNNPLLKKAGKLYGAYANVMTGGGYGAVDAMLNRPDAPDAPKIDPTLGNMRKAQANQAKDFRAGMPGYQQQLSSNLRQQGSYDLDQGLHDTRQANSSRGLLYGGKNLGDEQSVRGQIGNRMAQGTGQINTGLQSAANQLDANAVQSGLAIQQSSQQIQDQIYGQALARMNGNNAAFSGLMSAGGQIAGAAIGKRAGG